MPVELAVIVPTFNEHPNIQPLLGRLAETLHGIDYEVIFVDDNSPDRTAALVRTIAQRNPRVRGIQRIHRRGLASACIEGMLSTAAPYIAVMDADLQHDETVLPRMLSRLKVENLDLVIATRNTGGGSMGDFSPLRVRISNFGKRLGALVTHAELSDPMSGFFLLDRRYLEEVAPALSGIGFKILLDLVASARRPVRLAEIPYRFGQRLHGASKLDMGVGVEYLQLLLDKSIGHLVPSRFVMFGLVGTAGVFIHLAILYTLFAAEHRPFLYAQAAATFVGMTFNFFLNNAVTYRDQRLRGFALFRGLLTFYLACSIGALINLQMAMFGIDNGLSWFLSGLTGLAAGSVWNYAVTRMFTWRKQRAAALNTRSASSRSRVVSSATQ
ncbi:MAG: hypothetical protein RL328_1704 [Acidobacteriota bacterium]